MVAEDYKSQLIAEVAGLAGAGKTTLIQALRQRDSKLLIGAELELRKKGSLPVFIRISPYMLPVLFHRCQSSRWFTWEEIKYMVYLQGWPHVLRRQANTSRKSVLLDHGAIFKLATLNEFGPVRLKDQHYESWWHRMYMQWAHTLDMVIWLEAPESILVERINRRDQKHAMKGKSMSEARRFLARYRSSYEQILDKLAAYRQPSLLRFDTSKTTMIDIADEVIAVCSSIRA